VDGIGIAARRGRVKKVLAGCLIVLVIAVIGFGVAGYYAFRWAQPMIQSTGDYLDRARQMARLGDRVQNRAPYVPPASGELTASQVDRFVAVQTRVRDELGSRWAEIETKSAEIRDKTSASADTLRRDRQEPLTFGEFASVLSDISNIYMEARRAQVDALNVQKFSDAEYAWVRNRVYEAAGMEVASSIDMTKLEALARESAMKSNVRLPDIRRPDIPPANIRLIKPHLDKLKAWIPLAALGL
jgi:hypothetical protein